MNEFQSVRALKGRRPFVWSNRIGSFRYRNAIIRVDNNLIMSVSAGVSQEPFEPAIVAVDIKSGKIEWKVQTHGDPNRLVLAGNRIACGTDSGFAYILDPTGHVIAEKKLAVSLPNAPVPIGSSLDSEWLFASRDGALIYFSANEVNSKTLCSVDSSITTDVLKIEGDARESEFYFGGTGGDVWVWKMGLRKPQLISKAPAPFIERRGGGYKLDVREVTSVIDGGNNDLVISYARVTYNDNPPIYCIDRKSHEVKWKGKARRTVSKKDRSIGNIRSTPLIVNEEIVSTAAYTGFLFGISIQNGRILWEKGTGEYLFQNWATPVLAGDERIVVPRADGTVYDIDLDVMETNEIISLETPYEPFLFRPPDQTKIWPGDELTRGIAMTPYVDGNTLFVGTIGGELYAIELSKRTVD